ncbi:MAG: hypothetical protein HKN70_08985 [Gammaproteobacteria bacterium]|nr:hypothetical protein [Gammaproteobacteria bacterium]
MLRKLLVIGICSWVSVGACALGLGNIKLESALNEPLIAEIPLTVSSPRELENFRANVAGADTFVRYGLDRPAYLNTFSFTVGSNSAGEPVLLVRSSRAISEPFVTFLIEAVWDRGRLLREYTVLLDPPVFNEQAVAAPVDTARSAAALPSASSGQIIRPTSPPAPQPVPRSAYRPVAISGESYGPVRRNENLWNISKSAMVDGVSINQMMVAIYNANPNAFMGNINLLKEGSTLQIPTADTIRGLARSAANSVVVDHNASWRSGSAGSSRVAKAAAAGTAAPASNRLRLVAPEEGDTGAGSAGLADELNQTRDALAQEQAANAELGGEVDQLRAELEETKRLLNLQNSNLADLQRRLAEQGDTGVDVSATSMEPAATDPVDVSTPAVDEASTSVDVDPEAATTGVDTAVTSTAPDPTATAQPAPTTTTAPVAEPPVAVADEPGFIAKILGLFSNLWTWLGIGLLALLGTLFVVLRGRESSEDESWDAFTSEDKEVSPEVTALRPETASAPAAASATEDVEYFEDTGTFKPVDFDPSEPGGDAPEGTSETKELPFDETMAGETGVKLDHADPIAEADFHMAYGLYDQAAELVASAVESEPARTDLHMKLLEIYFVWGNKNAFRDKASTMQQLLGSEHPGEWEKIVIMGKQICPDDDLFAGEAVAQMAGNDFDLQLEETGSAPMDFAMGTPDSPDPGGDTSMVDIDLSDAFPDAGGDAMPAIQGDGPVEVSDDNVVDLDLGDALFASDEAPTAAGDDDGVLDFSFDEVDTGLDDTDSSPTANREEVRNKIEQALSESGEVTEELNLEDLGVDLNFGDSAPESEGVSSAAGTDDGEEDFDELFAGFEDPQEQEVQDATVDFNVQDLTDSTAADKLLDTSELRVEMEELLAAENPGIADSEQTARGLRSLDDDEALEDTGSFSAEIRALSEEEVEIGDELAAVGSENDETPGADDNTVVQETNFVAPDLPLNPPPEVDLGDGFAGSDDATVLQEAIDVSLFEDAESDVDGEMDAVFANAESGADSDMDAVFADATGDSDPTSTTAMASFEEQPASTGDADSDASEDTTTLSSLEASEDDPTGSAAVTFHGVFDEPTIAQDPLSDDFSDAIFADKEDVKTQEMPAMDLDVGESIDESGEGTTMRVATSNLALPENTDLAINEVGTKLDLARAYLDMGDPDGARGILEEVIKEGNEGQQSDARELLQGISS